MCLLLRSLALPLWCLREDCEKSLALCAVAVAVVLVVTSKTDDDAKSGSESLG